jgi:hypothetical protein
MAHGNVIRIARMGSNLEKTGTFFVAGIEDRF